MSLAGLALVLAAALCHATWNFCLKRINGGPELIWLFSLWVIILYAPVALWVLLVERPVFTVASVAFIVGSALLHLGYFVLLQTGYRKGDLSLVYPVARATGPVLSTLLAILFLQEQVTLQMGAGALTIIFGVLMLTGGIKRGARNASASLFFGLAAGSLIGSYTAWDAYAVSVLLVSPLLLDYTSSIARLIVLAPTAYRRRSVMRAQWRDHKIEVLAIAVFSPLAYILVLYALTFTPVAFVAPLREVSVVLTVLAGSLILKESHLRARVGWAVVILMGMGVLVSA